MFEKLAAQAPDSLLALIGAFRDDPRPEKIDLGVGVYRDAAGRTPVFAAMKAAERRLLETQESKAYLGPEGNLAFARALAPIVLGPLAGDERIIGVQTPGGTGALRLAAELIAAADRNAHIWLGTPSWPNHAPLMKAAGLAIRTYRHFDPATQSVCFAEMIAALEQAEAGDVVLLHGCCHNPTGADLSSAQWQSVAELLAARRLVPLIDLAYQGLGDGLEEDAAGLRHVLTRVDEALIAYSCDKNFGLYRERVGMLFVRGRDGASARVAYSNVLTLARANWSMPPDHGAAAVALILEDDTLRADWRRELDSMRTRIAGVRAELAAADPAFAALAGQKGMFSLLPLSKETIEKLRKDKAIYMAASGRISVCGLTPANLPRFVDVMRAALAAEGRA